MVFFFFFVKSLCLVFYIYFLIYDLLISRHVTLKDQISTKDYILKDKNISYFGTMLKDCKLEVIG